MLTNSTQNAITLLGVILGVFVLVSLIGYPAIQNKLTQLQLWLIATSDKLNAVVATIPQDKRNPRTKFGVIFQIWKAWRKAKKTKSKISA